MAVAETGDGCETHGDDASATVVGEEATPRECEDGCEGDEELAFGAGLSGVGEEGVEVEGEKGEEGEEEKGES